MEIIQQISNHPFTPTIKRKVRVLTDFTNYGVSRINLAGGNIAENPKIEAQYEVFEYVEVIENDINGDPQTVEKIITIKNVVYACSDSARIAPNLTTRELFYITDETFENFHLYPTEVQFVLDLKLKSVVTVGGVEYLFYKTKTTIEGVDYYELYTAEEINKIFILNIDDRNVFNN